MNSQIQSNKDRPGIEKPMTYTESQVYEDIRPITPFSSEEEVKCSSKMQRRATQDDNQPKELWRCHLKLNNLSLPKIKLMASQGKLPKRLIVMDVPFCPACVYSKATSKPYRYKNGNNKLKETSKSGQYVSIDTFESSTMGFVAQLKGSITNKRYKVVTIFIDHYSDYLVCIHKRTIPVQN